MTMVSKSQSRYLHANKPGVAAEFASRQITPISALPENKTNTEKELQQEYARKELGKPKYNKGT